MVCTFLFLVAGLVSAGSEWTSFRGPNGSGRGEGDPPVVWSEWCNVRWKTPVAGRGWSSPVLAGDRIWLTSALDGGHVLKALCFDGVTGRQVHDITVFTPEKPDPVNSVNSRATPTPVVGEGHVYVSFGNMGLACIEMGSGRVVWRTRELRLDHKEGPGSSPILWHDRLILACDGTDIQYIAAVDAATGRILWRTPRSAPLAKLRFDIRKAYGTPAIVRVGERDQVISCGAKRFYGYDPRDGRELWYVEHPGFNVPQVPVTALGDVLLGTGWNRGSLLAVRLDPAARGNITASHVDWRLGRDAPRMPSPLVLGDRVFLVSDDGVLSWVNAANGKPLWRRKMLGKVFASPVSASGRLYVVDARGRSVVMRADDPPEVLAENHLAAGCMATPAIWGDSLIVRTTTHLYRLERR